MLNPPVKTTLEICVAWNQVLKTGCEDVNWV